MLNLRAEKIFQIKDTRLVVAIDGFTLPTHMAVRGAQH
jgi:hypothetical protein